MDTALPLVTEKKQAKKPDKNAQGNKAAKGKTALEKGKKAEKGKKTEKGKKDMAAFDTIDATIDELAASARRAAERDAAEALDLSFRANRLAASTRSGVATLPPGHLGDVARKAAEATEAYARTMAEQAAHRVMECALLPMGSGATSSGSVGPTAAPEVHKIYSLFLDLKY